MRAGIEVQFTKPAAGDPAHSYRVGDFWTFSARVATGRVDWPTDVQDEPLAQPPAGPVHHYAPLGRLDTDGKWTDRRRRFTASAACRKV